MNYVKIKDKQYSAVVQTRLNDSMWEGRESKAVTIAASHAEAAALFVDDTPWYVLSEQPGEDGNTVITEEDMSAYALAGPITDNRDGTVTVKMGKYKDAELLDTLRSTAEAASQSLDDMAASTYPSLFPKLKQDGSLVSAGKRINWNGKVKKAAADLWDTKENNPDNAPSLWEDISYKDGYRYIPEVITAAAAFAMGECGWWKDVLYRSVMDANVYTPEQYPQGWELA